jgi:hypothetical protein
MYNSVSALILLIASVILTLIVVGFAFGLVEYFISTPIVVINNAYILNNKLYITINNEGPSKVFIKELIIIYGGREYFYNVNYELNVGINTLAINISNIHLNYGDTVNFQLLLSDGYGLYDVAPVL